MKRTRGKGIGKDIEDIIIKDIEAIMLQYHVGKANAITVSDLSTQIDNHDTDITNSHTRQLIFKCIEQCELPIASCNNGYYIADTKEEMDEYVHNLHIRSVGIYERLLAFEKSYWGYKALQAPARPQEHTNHTVRPDTPSTTMLAKRGGKERGLTC